MYECSWLTNMAESNTLDNIKHRNRPDGLVLTTLEMITCELIAYAKKASCCRFVDILQRRYSCPESQNWDSRHRDGFEADTDTRSIWSQRSSRVLRLQRLQTSWEARRRQEGLPIPQAGCLQSLSHRHRWDIHTWVSRDIYRGVSSTRWGSSLQGRRRQRLSTRSSESRKKPSYHLRSRYDVPLYRRHAYCSV